VDIYNELFKKAERWEAVRNKVALKAILRSVYGDKNEDHRLVQAFRAFGVSSENLYQHVANRLSQQLSRIGTYVEPENLLAYMGHA
jgi:hypothetical protein